MLSAQQIINRLFSDVNLSAPKREGLQTLALRWINDGQRDIAQHTLCLESQALMRTKANRMQYPLPGQTPLTDCLGIQQILLDGRPLLPKTLTELAKIYSNWTTETGRPLYYLPRMGGFRWWVWLIPTPVSDSYKLLIFYYRKPKQITQDNQRVVVDVDLLLKFMKWRLYEHLGDKQADRFQVQYISEREQLAPTLRVKQMQEMPTIKKVWP